ncbi:transcription initiation factor TFIID subunit 6 [Drosophila santomea]|uniref:transcription initiation factor TFIID subunit 6 n=1 Tax=Drosophila santomea TaxID=129105 RepID=UPI00195300D2|nr:transcription initiation factor TFIID subunit 6 [Drosophila santomea]
MWQFENKKATEMRTSCNEMPDKDERFRKKSLSRRSLYAISLHNTGQRLDDGAADWLSLNLKEDITNLLNEAGKYMRRIRERLLNLSHIQHAVRMDDNLRPDIFFRLVHCDYCTRPLAKNVPRIINEAVTNENEDIPLVTGPESIPQISLNPSPVHHGWFKVERVLLSSYKHYPLTKEQQSFFELVTEACVGTSDSRRQRALQTLTTDPSIEVLLPRLTMFIADAVAINVKQQDMTMLLYLMRMIRSLLGNHRFSLLQYLHLLLPAVLSCVLAKQVSASPDVDDHWALREYSGNIMAHIGRQFDAADTSILPRVIGVYKKALLMKPLTTVFGAVIGLGKLGNHVVRACIVPQLKYLSEHTAPYMTTDKDRLAAKYIRHRVVKMCAPVLISLHQPPDLPEQYMDTYGSLGLLLSDSVKVMRMKIQTVADAKAEAEVALKKMAAEQHYTRMAGVRYVSSNGPISGNQLPSNGVPHTSQTSQSGYSIHPINVNTQTQNSCNPMLQYQKQATNLKPSDCMVSQSMQFRNALIPPTSQRSVSQSRNEMLLKPNNVCVRPPAINGFGRTQSHNGRMPINYLV